VAEIVLEVIALIFQRVEGTGSRDRLVGDPEFDKTLMSREPHFGMAVYEKTSGNA
jgi:hypothetical protein